MDPDPDAHRAWFEGSLSLLSRRDRVRGSREGDEEGVALRVDLDARVSLECVPQSPAVLGQDLRIPVSVLVEQPRRAFDVREEEGDRSARQLAHSGIIRQNGACA